MPTLLKLQVKQSGIWLRLEQLAELADYFAKWVNQVTGECKTENTY